MVNGKQDNIPKEYYLQYAGKAPEQDILADTMSVPFQAVKHFPANVKIDGKDWHNMLIFGDNLQALKHLLKRKKEGKLRNPDGTDGVKLIYIDPPFGTGDQYDASGDKPAYSAKLQGVSYLEFLRKRFILLRELLTDDGSIYVRIDYHFGHYVKVILDEVFGKVNFLNEIIINRTRAKQPPQTYFTPQTDSLFFYKKGEENTFNQILRNKNNPEWYELLHFPRADERPRKILGKDFFPPKNRRWALSQDKIDSFEKKGKIRVNIQKEYTDCSGKRIKGVPELFYDEEPVRNEWLDLAGYGQSTHYPTENAEELLARVINASSNPSDLVLDCFAGSGTTGAVAEKLGRRWIMCDVGKLSIYTITKRLMSLKSEIGNKGKDLKPKPFVLYNAGLYDYNLIEKMGQEDYKKFCLELFQVEPKKQRVGGFEMDGVRDNAPVYIFLNRYLTKEFIESLHKSVGENLTKKMFLIAPASSVKFFEDYIEIDGIRYYVLRIPYSIIDEIEKREFTPIKQPDSASELNDIVEAVGFDFIEPPIVEAEYIIGRPGGKLTEVAQIKIKKFKSNQRSKKEKQVKDEDALSAILIDRDYNNEYFRLTDKFFKDEIKDNIIEFSPELGKKVGIIYIDIYGNERIEVLDSKVFKK
jgi:site-specific DNA-methyltransferase (adenine-specific)/adenine-specific DNA-methyltransferase